MEPQTKESEAGKLATAAGQGGGLVIASDIPDFMTEQLQASPDLVGGGLSNIRSKDVTIPRVQLMQAMSKLVATEGKFKSGDMVHNIDQKLIAEPDAPVKIVVIKHYLQWIEWKDRDVNNGGINDSSLDENSALARRYARGETSRPWLDEAGNRVMKTVKVKGVPTQVECDLTLIEYHNFVVLMPEISASAPILISCGKTNWKHGKNLCSRMKTREGIPMLVNGVRKLVPAPAFAGLYTVKTTNETNSSGQTYKVFKFDNAGWVDKNLWAIAESAYNSFKDKVVVADHDDNADVSASASAASNPSDM